MANILISTHWSAGDVFPFIEIGKSLKKQGHRVIIFTHSCYRENIERVNLEFVPWDTLEECKKYFNALVKYDNKIEKLNQVDILRENYESKEFKLREYNLMKEYCISENTIIIAKNRSSIGALLVAEKFNVPIIYVYMNPMEYESLEEFSKLKYEKLKSETNEMRKLIGLSEIENWFEWQMKPIKHIGLWPEWYRSKIIKDNFIEKIGFPLRRLEKKFEFNDDKLKGLLKTRPIIISGGSSKKIGTEFYITAIEACENIKKNIIVLCKYREMLPEKLKDNVYVFEFIPLYEALENVSLIIHHGGIGTASNAIYTKTPQLILGQYFDCPINGNIIKSIGVGDYLPPIKWKKEIVSKKVQELLEDRQKECCKKFFEENVSIDTFDRINILIDRILNKNYVSEIEKKVVIEQVIKKEIDKKILLKNLLKNRKKIE